MSKTPKNITGENYHIMVGNALERLKELPDNSVDSIVTDPPYGLSDNKFVAETIAKWIEGEREFVPDGKGFMGKAWDAFVPPPAIWDECLRVLKPGGHLLAFFGTRTQDIGALAIRLAGFEIRDSVAWLYGSGFPKSLDISKAIDKQAGAERESNIVPTKSGNSKRKGLGEQGSTYGDAHGGFRDMSSPSSDAAKQYEGWGTALKPAHEPIVVARKPISEKTVANNVLQWGTGGLNIDASRVGTDKITINGQGNDNMFHGKFSGNVENPERTGRFPANLILSHSEDCQDTGETITESYTNHNAPKGTFAGGEPDRGSDTSEYKAQTTSTPVYQCVPGCPVAELDEQSGVSKSSKGITTSSPTALGQNSGWNAHENKPVEFENYGDSGGASRFFYVAKANKKDRNEGLEELKPTKLTGRDEGQDDRAVPYKTRTKITQNIHPTVKPTALMEYLVRLVTPVGGTVLDPFTGSGSTGKAAILGGFKFIGVELTEDYLPIIEGRLSWAEENKEQYQADKAKSAQKAAKAEQNTPPKATGGSLTALDAAEVALQAVAKKKGLESHTALPLFDEEQENK